MSTEVIYTDGACSSNGKKGATGGFGIFIAKSKLFSGSYKINRKGEQMDFNNGSSIQTFYVTNIRMEGLAILSVLELYAFTLIIDLDDGLNLLENLNSHIDFNTTGLTAQYATGELKQRNKYPEISIEIITDSLFWMNVINDWMPKWIKKGILLEKKNPDILLLLCYYTEILKQNNVTVRYTHVKSHQKGKRSIHADGNDMADVLATSAVNNTSTKFHLN